MNPSHLPEACSAQPEPLPPELPTQLAEGTIPSAQAWVRLADGTNPSSEAEVLAGLLAGFHLASRSYAERTPHPAALAVPQQPGRAGKPRRLLSFATVVACLVLLTSLLLARPKLWPGATKGHLPAHLKTQQPAQLSDDALLQGVQQDLAQAVPVSLRSLSASGGGTGTTSSPR